GVTRALGEAARGAGFAERLRIGVGSAAVAADGSAASVDVRVGVARVGGARACRDDRGFAARPASGVFAGATGETGEERCDESGTRDDARAGPPSAVSHAAVIPARRSATESPRASRADRVAWSELLLLG